MRSFFTDMKRIPFITDSLTSYFSSDIIAVILCFYYYFCISFCLTSDNWLAKLFLFSCL